jgi:hypothetical protein
MIGQPLDAVPGERVLLTAPSQRPQPRPGDVMPEAAHASGIGGYSVVREVPLHHLP